MSNEQQQPDQKPNGAGLAALASRTTAGRRQRQVPTPRHPAPVGAAAPVKPEPPTEEVKGDVPVDEVVVKPEPPAAAPVQDVVDVTPPVEAKAPVPPRPASSDKGHTQGSTSKPTATKRTGTTGQRPVKLDKPIRDSSVELVERRAARRADRARRQAVAQALFPVAGSAGSFARLLAEIEDRRQLLVEEMDRARSRGATDEEVFETVLAAIERNGLSAAEAAEAMRLLHLHGA